jgi:hypothetical protein
VSAPAAQAKNNIETFDAIDLREPTDLSTTWLVHAGDDPAYARADFDDSQWTPFNPHSSIVDVFKQTRPEVVWYRLRVKVNPLPLASR